MSSFHVIAPGMLTSVQDLGRWGLQSRGVPVAGPMDPHAHRLANALVGNAAGLATLEITLIGPDLEFDDERIVAAAGATFDLTLDGAPVSMPRAFSVAAGSRLKFGQRRRGARAYLAIGGGVSVPPVLGSRATHLTSAMGGLDGRALKAGDRLPLGAGNSASRRDSASGRDWTPDAGRSSAAVERLTAVDRPGRLRVLPGPQFDSFDADAVRVLQTAPYTVDPHSDRMAFRLAGAPLVRAAAGEMISDATPMGTIQVLPTGLPLLLMADRQTTGGYPQIATVISADFGIAGQLAPGDSVSFQICSLAEAMAALIAQERVLLNVESRWAS